MLRLILLISFAIYCKSATSQLKYKRLEAKTATSEFIININICKDKLTGNIFEKTTKKYTEITGSIKNGKYVLVGKNDKDQIETAYFNASTRGIMQGWMIWNNIKSHCTFTEKYPVGSLQISGDVLKKSDTLLESGFQAVVCVNSQKWDIETPTPSNKVLTKFMQKLMFGTENIESSNSELINYKWNSLATYLPDKKEMAMYASDRIHIFEENNVLQVWYNENHIFSFSVVWDAYTGGAHGMYGTKLYSFNTLTGQELNYDLVFVPNSKAKVSALIEAKIKQENGIKPEENLIDNQFLVDKIQVTDNFCLLHNGILFFYNVYEIKPYSSGTTSVFLTYQELKGLLKNTHFIN